MKTYARRDEAFNEFMKEFKRKEEPKWANVLDFTEGSKEDLLLNKSSDFRVDEIAMLEEFRRRKKIKSYYKEVYATEVGSLMAGQGRPLLRDIEEGRCGVRGGRLQEGAIHEITGEVRTQKGNGIFPSRCGGGFRPKVIKRVTM